MLSWLCKYWVRVHFDDLLDGSFVPSDGTYLLIPILGRWGQEILSSRSSSETVVNLGYLRPCQKNKTKQNGVGRIKLDWFLSKCFIWHLKQKLSDFLKHKFTFRKSTQNFIPSKLTVPWSATLLELIRGVCKVSIPEFTLNTFYLKLPF